MLLFRGRYDQPDAGHKYIDHDGDLAQKFRLNISDDGDGKLVKLTPILIYWNKKSDSTCFTLFCFT